MRVASHGPCKSTRAVAPPVMLCSKYADFLDHLLSSFAGFDTIAPPASAGSPARRSCPARLHPCARRLEGAAKSEPVEVHVVHGYLFVAHLHQLHTLDLDPLAGGWQLSAIPEHERTRVRSDPSELIRKGVALFEGGIQHQGLVWKTALQSVPFFADGGTTLEGAVGQGHNRVFSVEVGVAVDIPGVCTG